MDLTQWRIAHLQACEAERMANAVRLLSSASDREFLRLRSRELRIRADCMLADLVARSRSVPCTPFAAGTPRPARPAGFRQTRNAP